MTAVSLVAPGVILVACAASLWWLRRRATRRGDIAAWSRTMRRTLVALAVCIGGAFGLAMLALGLGASSRAAERVGAVWQLAFLVAVVGWRVARRG